MRPIFSQRLSACLSLALLFVLAAGGCRSIPIAMASSPGLPATLTSPATSTIGQAVNVGQHPRTTTIEIVMDHQKPKTVEVNYLLYLPYTYGKDPLKKWPLILFLHGRGERGNNLDLLKIHPLPGILDQQADFPFIVVSPQLPADYLWWSDKIKSLNIFLYHIQAMYSVDPQRIYLTGISMGGFGTWEFALRFPNRFAAIVPIAGGYQEGNHEIPANLCDLRKIPIWVFHGGADVDVQPFQSEVLVDGLKKCGSAGRFTLYPDANHTGSWTRAYANPELYQWLLSQKLK
jgi:predicted peptidase